MQIKIKLNSRPTTYICDNTEITSYYYMDSSHPVFETQKIIHVELSTQRNPVRYLYKNTSWK